MFSGYIRISYLSHPKQVYQIPAPGGVPRLASATDNPHEGIGAAGAHDSHLNGLGSGG